MISNIISRNTARSDAFSVMSYFQHRSWRCAAPFQGWRLNVSRCRRQQRQSQLFKRRAIREQKPSDPNPFRPVKTVLTDFQLPTNIPWGERRLL